MWVRCLFCCFPQGRRVWVCGAFAWWGQVHAFQGLQVWRDDSHRFGRTLSFGLQVWAQSATQLGGEEVELAAAGEFPKLPPSVSFLAFSFWKIPHAQASIQGPALLQRQFSNQTGAIRVRARHGLTLNSSQPVSTVSVGAHRPHVFATSSLFPSLWLQATRSLLVLLKPCLAGEGAVDPALSQKPCGRPCGCNVWGCSHLGPCAGSRNLIVLKHSPYRLIFQCPLHFLVSYLHICWGTVGCSLCSSEDQLGISPMCRGKWTPLPPISPSSYLISLSNSIY